MNQAVKTHAHAVWARMEQIKSSQSFSTINTVAPAYTAPPPSSSRYQDDLQYKRNVYRDQYLFLTESLSLPDNDEAIIGEYWETKSESEVCRAMQQLSHWQKSVEGLSKAFRDYETSAQQSGVSQESTFLSDSEDFEYLRLKVKEVSIAVKEEDQKRNLQTLMPSKTEKVKYPAFSGDVGVDFLKFKKKLEECFRKNRVPQSDMLDKLRENLRGAALKRVPETVKDISVA